MKKVQYHMMMARRELAMLTTPSGEDGGHVCDICGWFTLEGPFQHSPYCKLAEIVRLIGTFQNVKPADDEQE